jgi:hypothetical protein
MEHLHYEFDLNKGDVVEVTLDHAANVQLLTPANYEEYRNGRLYHYYGGYGTTSPVRLTVPEAGHWHVVVDLGGGTGRVRASVRLVTKDAALPHNIY